MKLTPLDSLSAEYHGAAHLIETAHFGMKPRQQPCHLDSTVCMHYNHYRNQVIDLPVLAVLLSVVRGASEVTASGMTETMIKMTITI